MKYKLLFNKKVLKTLKKLGANDRKIIIKWLEKNIDNSPEPRQFGKALKGNLRDYWRYRIGKYRVIVSINDDELVVLTIDVGHRKDIY
ncbi:type II toxin-antitoxin system RelE/ParE family toxin [Jeotgalicoccus nanhaiensis]|uniref:Type II toxin-antitoxin system RelE/ParE family toxin n=1 Tax=Jeotgalicoccus nanhaiensis TaxID=568603 RepID=A0ABR9XVR2_9STAP|nr:type II toxin-antitoxin system RelE/ParE family toxin [Jeotgalicoccus nanhaiensis]MBF0753031.1 type II toxin-antitoxin system RelE/ParE family toxin [Jeotgalicoccus nanhaiensis]TFU63182.1 type II toxin-antitoxin system RelE/ParE family toxin [Jeotgalicoccus nanhaiensis]